MSRYAVHPMEQEFRNWELRHRQKRDQYWNSLYEIRQEYMAEFKGITDLSIQPPLHVWAEDRYGFKMGVDVQGHYTQDYTVTDPKKFMLCQIKYFK